MRRKYSVHEIQLPDNCIYICSKASLSGGTNIINETLQIKPSCRKEENQKKIIKETRNL